jgi:putative nucleotidyltransferase with HDIG domain
MIAAPPGLAWLVLVGLTILAGSFTVTLPALPAKLSASETFVLTATLLFGPSAGAITVLVDSLAISFWSRTARNTPARFLFNAVAPATAIRAAAEVFFGVTKLRPGEIGSVNTGGLVAAILGLAFFYFACNTLLIAGAMVADRGSAALKMWRRNLPAVSVNYLVGGFIAMFVVAYIDEVNVAVLGIVIPVLLVSYVTFKTSIGRLDDANRHVQQISDLYLSTIEALAMAVDAKDQITHGHIRRVQVFATQLAQRLGVHDDAQLRAIETAALLHDMGKLAIPEFILNKPGKLTAAEFEKMKRHADIGADLLSSISFPYPVIPIVRHHHENWNGTGYPSRLAGHDIPLGARILSVVDCFDALTSDRPYRPRMSDEESFRILRERSGSMYDPLIVDTFIQVFPEVAPAAIRAGQQARSLVPTFSPNKRPAALEEIRTNAAQSSVLGQFGPAVTHTSSLDEAIQVTAQYVGMLTPATVCALFVLEPDTNSLRCIRSAGDDSSILPGLVIPHGERTTGWACAHETVMANSPATLDLEERAGRFDPPLRSALVAPLLRDGRVVGSLSVYSTQTNPYTDDHQYAIERIADTFVDHLELESETGVRVHLSTRSQFARTQ